MTTNEATTLPRVAVDMIKPGKTQPRTVFAEGPLLRLGETMLSAGVIQPIVVYRDADGMLALIAGERRWRAAKLVGIPELEYIEKPMPEMDAKARKMALIENLEREDLTPLEIAWAVRDQLAEKNEFDVPIYSRAQLADELGQDSHFILHCEALLKCSEALQQKVHRGEVPMRLAAMIGSLPPSLHEMAEADVITRPGGMMTIDAAGRHFAENYKRDLRKAKFAKEISGLIPDAPECAKCPFNGANRSDVQGKLRAMVCLNPACFDAKQVTVVETARAHSDTGVGVQVLGNDLRETIFSFDGVTIKGESGYVAADARPDGILLVNASAPCPTWGAMKEVEALTAVKIVDGEGALRTLYAARLALQAATAPDSTVKHLFKRAADVGGVPSGKTSLKNFALGASISTAEAVDEEAKNKARETGKIAAAQSWVSKVKEAEDAPTMREIVRLILEKLTEGADRKWMGKVLGSEPMEYFNQGGMWDVLSLALVARVMRLQGPGGVEGITGELCKLTGYKAAQEAKAIDAAVEKAGKVKGEGQKAKGKTEGEKPAEKPEYPELITPAVPADAKPIYGSALASMVAKVPSYTALPISAQLWLSVMLGDGVPQSLPNDHGVMVKAMKPEPLSWKGAKKHEWLNVDLAYHYEQRTWHSAMHLHEGTMSSGSPACASDPHATRQAAVLEALNQIKRSAGRHADESKAVALVDQMIAVLLEAFQASMLEKIMREAHFPTTDPERRITMVDAEPMPPSTLLKTWIEEGVQPAKKDDETPDLVPANASPEVEAFAKANGMVLMKPAKAGLKPRVKDAEAERIAWEKFLETGSVTEAAVACGKPFETVKNWYKRRKWKDVRAKSLAKSGK